METTIKKTRTRQKKEPVAVAVEVVPETGSLLSIMTQLAEPSEDVPIPSPVEKPTKKNKKPIQVVAVVTSNGIEGSFPSEQRRPLIGHLPISSAAVSFNDDTENCQPEAYADEYICTYGAPYSDTKKVSSTNSVSERSGVATANTTVATTIATVPTTSAVAPIKTVFSTTVPSYTQIQLFAEYIGAREQKQLPDKTDIACLWCCEHFSWKPAVIPCRYESDVMNGQIKGQYRVYGNYCCPECALAALLEENIDTNARWERISWMHMIYEQAVGGRLYPAPSRLTLKKFGGVYSIEEYRNLAMSHKIRADIHYPPMVSLLATMDTKPIDFYEAPIKQALPTYAFEREGMGEDGLRLKRTKPLKEHDSTLDACIQIKMRVLGGTVPL